MKATTETELQWIKEVTWLTEEQLKELKIVGPAQEARMHKNSLVRDRKRMYLFYCKSGFFTTWKSIWVEESTTLHEEDFSALIEFNHSWEGFEIIDYFPTDLYEITN